LTGFDLKGKHQAATCVACHKPDTTKVVLVKQVPFTGLKGECTTCHENVHDLQFEVEGVTDCKRCHQFEQWKPSDFDHNTARFVLDGAHKNVACKECHKKEIIEGKSVIQYRTGQLECVNCHN
jgi:hypothetical protein